jgi:hypothetical protein
MNCRTSAQHAVASLLAPDSVDDYNYLPYFYSRVFNLAWQVRACSTTQLVRWPMPMAARGKSCLGSVCLLGPLGGSYEEC